MTREEKQLLLKDLCARLPYGVKVCARFNTGNRYTANVTAICEDRDYVQIRQNALHPYMGSSIEDIRSYLRPMSSMTEEEKDELLNLRKEMNMHMHPWIDRILDFYLSHHLDWRGLILLGLALEAPEDMYKTE